MLIKEINTIPEFNEVATGYQIYDNGQVWSNRSNKFLTLTKTYPSKNKTGYHLYTVSLQLKNKKSKQFLIHRIVACAFIPNDNLTLYTEINHIDSNTANNSITNLEWITPLKNKQLSNHQNKHSAIKSVWRCDKNTHQRIEKYTSIMDAERAGYGNHSGIVATCKGRQKSCGNYFWEYDK